MNDEQLKTALESLPRERAGIGFTAGVLRRIEQPSPRFFPVRWTVLTAAATIVLALGFGWREWRHRQAEQHLQVLLAEKHDLEVEMQVLRRLSREARPVIYLGGNEKVDLVLDLARFQRQGGFGSNQAVPAQPIPDRRGVMPRGEHTARPLRVVY